VAHAVRDAQPLIRDMLADKQMPVPQAGSLLRVG
jgi:hypothetical protein